MENRQRNLKSQKGSTGGELFDPKSTEKNSFHFNPADKKSNVLEGYLLEIKEGVGQNNSDVIEIHEALPDGTLVRKRSLWSDKVLEDQFNSILTNPAYGLGCFVVVEYQGRKLKKGVPVGTPWNKGNSFHMWEVLVDVDAPKYDPSKLMGQDALATAQTHVQQQAQPHVQTSTPVQSNVVQQPVVNQAVSPPQPTSGNTNSVVNQGQNVIPEGQGINTVANPFPQKSDLPF